MYLPAIGPGVSGGARPATRGGLVANLQSTGVRPTRVAPFADCIDVVALASVIDLLGWIAVGLDAANHASRARSRT